MSPLCTIPAAVLVSGLAFGIVVDAHGTGDVCVSGKAARQPTGTLCLEVQNDLLGRDGVHRPGKEHGEGQEKMIRGLHLPFIALAL